MPKTPSLVSMAYDDGEGMAETGPSLLSKPEHPYGLCFTLTERELKRLDLDEPDAPGDIVHLNVMARVKSVSKSENGMCTVNCVIEAAMVLENENMEHSEESEEEDED